MTYLSARFKTHLFVLSFTELILLCYVRLVSGRETELAELGRQCPPKTKPCEMRVQTTNISGCSIIRCAPIVENQPLNETVNLCTTATVLYSIADDMYWTRILVVYDNTSEPHLTVENIIPRENVIVTMLNVDTSDIDTFTASVRPLYRESVEQNLYLTVLVICSARGLRNLTDKIQEFHESLPRFSAFDLRSLWLVGVTSDMKIHFEELQLTFLNVALITILSRQRNIYTEKRYNIKSCRRCSQKTRNSCEIFHSPKIDQKYLFPNTTQGLSNMNLTVATLPSTNFVIRTVIKGHAIYSGLCIDILDFLSTALHFKYTVVEPADGKWGKETEKGEYNGIVGEIISQKIDFIAAPLIPRTERVNVMDFSVPYFWDRVVVILKKPGVNNIKWKTLLNPFRLIVFVCIGVSVVVVVVFISFVESVNPFYEKTRPRSYWKLKFNFFWYIYGSLLRQGGRNLPHSLSGRLLIATWAMFCTIIAAAYCTNLIAFLSVNKEVLKYKTLADLLQDDSLKWGAQGNYYFSKLKQGQDKMLWPSVDEKHKAAFLDRDEKKHKVKLLEGSYVFVAHYHHISSWALSDCNLQLIVPALSVPVLYTFGFPLNSDFTKLFSLKLMEMTQNGLLDEALKRAHAKMSNTTCGQSDPRTARTIDLEDLQTAFYILCMGIVLSAMSLVIEICAVKSVCRHLFKRSNKITKVDLEYSPE